MTHSPGTRGLVLVATILVSAAQAAAAEQGAKSAPPNGCVSCHTALADPKYALPVTTYRGDVHAARGFSCVDCHGGDATTTDKAKAKDPSRGYRGRPQGADLIATCARCHSNAEFMRGFAPRQRVDQAVEYAASGHGKRLAQGDTRVATCVSCHSVHDIRQVSDARSPVFPTNVAATCGRCHADTAHMAGYKRADGSPLPTNQRADYETSIHYAALVKRNDLSAPTCNDCHGNHGAAPPGVGAVTNVCGTCHATFAAKFALSTHSQIFDRGCVECHGNHAIPPTSDELIGTSPKAICATCHSAGEAGYLAAGQIRAGLDRLKGELNRTSDLISSVQNAGMEVSEQELALGEARAHVTLVRTELHTSNPAAVEPIVAEGLGIVAGVDRAGAAAQAELLFRRKGLFASLIAILLVVVGLAFKIRDLNRRHQH